MILWYLHRPHRARHVAARAHPVPQLVEAVPLPLLELANADRVHTRCPGIVPDLLPRPEPKALRNIKRLHRRFRSAHRLLPRQRGWPQVDLACTAPWPRPHYRAFTATPGRSAPVPRATLPLTVSAAWGPPSRGQITGITGWPPVSRRQVLQFRASACDELTPPLHRAPPGPRAGSSLAEGPPAGAPLSRGRDPILSFDAICMSFDASAVVRTCSSSRRSPHPVSPGLFPERSPPRLFTSAASGGLGSPPARRARRAKPPSLAQHGSCWRPSTSPPLAFLDTRTPGHIAPMTPVNGTSELMTQIHDA